MENLLTPKLKLHLSLLAKASRIMDAYHMASDDRAEFFNILGLIARLGGMTEQDAKELLEEE